MMTDTSVQDYKDELIQEVQSMRNGIQFELEKETDIARRREHVSELAVLGVVIDMIKEK